MVKAQVISMQSVAALRSWCSVKVIIIKRAADMCHMYAYLVGTASVQLQFQQTEMFPAADKFIISTGILSVWRNTALNNAAFLSGNWSFYYATVSW